MATPPNPDQRNTPLLCQTRARLMRDVKTAADAEAEAVARASRDLASASLDEHDALQVVIQDLHRRTEEAQAALREHRQSHGC